MQSLFKSLIPSSWDELHVPPGLITHIRMHTCTHVIGSRSALVNMEVRGEVAPILNRKCVIIRWSALSSEKFLDIIHRGAGAIVVLLPRERGGVDEVEGEGGVRVHIYAHVCV